MDSRPREEQMGVADRAALQAIGQLRRLLRPCEKSVAIICF